MNLDVNYANGKYKGYQWKHARTISLNKATRQLIEPVRIRIQLKNTSSSLTIRGRCNSRVV